jgi:hypothetical protein
MTQYEIVKQELSTVLKRTDDDGVIWWIPMDESNSDYQAYLNKDKPEAALSTPIVSSDE